MHAVHYKKKNNFMNREQNNEMIKLIAVRYHILNEINRI